MELTSPAFLNGGNIPSEYTCDGQDLSPPLQISGVPKGAKSLVLIVDDPDVPEFVRKDKMWVHWVVVNIAPQDQIIEKNHAPKGIKGKGTAGSLDWQGPCPPDREHRYFFKLYALDVPLTLQQGASKREVEAAMRGHILTEAQLMGRYERQGVDK